MFIYLSCRIYCICCVLLFFFFKQKTAYEMRISDWSSDVCSSDLLIQLEFSTDFQAFLALFTPFLRCPVPFQPYMSQSESPITPEVEADLPVAKRGCDELLVDSELAPNLANSRATGVPLRIKPIGSRSRRESVCQYG